MEINGRLEENPDLINQDPFGDGWIVKMRLADSAELKSLFIAADYEN